MKVNIEYEYMGRKQNALQLGMTLYSHQKIDEQRNRKEKKKEIRKLTLENWKKRKMKDNRMFYS